MIITLVMDQYGDSNNGTTITAQRFAEILKKRGHTIRVLTCKPCAGENVYGVERYHVPLFDGLILSQGMTFAKPDDEVIKQAITGADIVHFLMPFFIQNRARELCDEMHIPYTAAFHVQPENITYSIHLGHFHQVNNMIYKMFNRYFYQYVTHVHCPSKMIANQLVEHGYKNTIHVISNGVGPAFKRLEVAKPKEYEGKYVILMIGRFSREKRQDILIKAINKSKYKDKIQLVLCGKGPWKDKLTKMSNKLLTNPTVFTFLEQKDLIDLINYSDFYVHASDAEIEAIACMEAFTCGLVPIISDSKLSATNQFSQSPHCLFKKGNSADLADKIDYFIEHPEELKILSKTYEEYAKQYALENCVIQLEKVFELEIKEFHDKEKKEMIEDTKK